MEYQTIIVTGTNTSGLNEQAQKGWVVQSFQLVGLHQVDNLHPTEPIFAYLLQRGLTSAAKTEPPKRTALGGKELS